jgi:hypothetical protein
MGGLDRVADILAVAKADMPQQRALGRKDRAGIAAIRAGLFAADEQFCRTVQFGGRKAGGFGDRGDRFQRLYGRGRFEIGQQPFPP